MSAWDDDDEPLFGYPEKKPAAQAAKKKVVKIRESFGDWRDDLQRSDHGIVANVANVALIMTKDPLLQGVFAYNEFSSKYVLTKATPETLGITGVNGFPRTCEKADRSLVLIYIQRVYSPSFKPETVNGAIEAACMGAKFHPVRQYLANLTWDGVPRIGTWLTDCFGAEQTPYLHAVGTKFLQAAVRRVKEPGCKFDPMLILEGPQDLGKSLACRALFGDWFTDSMPAELSDKDTMDALQGMWGVEFAEIEQILKTEAEAFKAFMTKPIDSYRAAYGHGRVDRPRQCVFMGTTNRSDYARDDTGNRRLWPVKCVFAKADWLKEWRDQLWAEAAATEPGAKLWLDDDQVRAEAKMQQAARHDTEVWEDRILDWLDGRAGPVTIPDILTNAIEIPVERHHKGYETRVSKVLRRNGWENEAKWIGGRTKKVWNRAEVVRISGQENNPEELF